MVVATCDKHFPGSSSSAVADCHSSAATAAVDCKLRGGGHCQCQPTVGFIAWSPKEKRQNESAWEVGSQPAWLDLIVVGVIATKPLENTTVSGGSDWPKLPHLVAGRARPMGWTLEVTSGHGDQRSISDDFSKMLFEETQEIPFWLAFDGYPL